MIERLGMNSKIGSERSPYIEIHRQLRQTAASCGSHFVGPISCRVLSLPVPLWTWTILLGQYSLDHGFRLRGNSQWSNAAYLGWNPRKSRYTTTTSLGGLDPQISPWICFSFRSCFWSTTGKLQSCCSKRLRGGTLPVNRLSHLGDMGGF